MTLQSKVKVSIIRIFDMDVLYDSDLSDVSEIEIDQPAPIRPYMYEPTIDAAAESSSSDENGSSSASEESVSEDHESISGPDVSTWCHCGNYHNMPTLTECKCCQTTNVVDSKLDGLACITDHEGFQSNCLNIHVLQVAYYDHIIQSGPREENQRIHELYRHLAYKRFTRWVYGLLGRKVRKVIPSCAVIAIRNAFPSDGYRRFKYPG